MKGSPWKISLPLPCSAAHGSLGAIIGNVKSVMARRINQVRDAPGAPVWQRNYYEHVVRTEGALRAIREYTCCGRESL